jgi:hypothetical protein
MTELALSDDALDLLRPVFLAVEGDCEAWEDAEIARKVFIRGAMDYARSAGYPWAEISGLAKALRRALAAP